MCDSYRPRCDQLLGLIAQYALHNLLRSHMGWVDLSCGAGMQVCCIGPGQDLCGHKLWAKTLFCDIPPEDFLCILPTEMMRLAADQANLRKQSTGLQFPPEDQCNVMASGNVPPSWREIWAWIPPAWCSLGLPMWEVLGGNEFHTQALLQFLAFIKA